MRTGVAALLALALSVAAHASAQSTRVAIIVGLAGEPEHAELFQRWGATLFDAAIRAGLRRDDNGPDGRVQRPRQFERANGRASQPVAESLVSDERYGGWSQGRPAMA